jgi:hypothetical protein
MFTGVTHEYEWFTPMLLPKLVSSKMFEILESNRSTELTLPFYTRFTPILKFIPIELSDLFKHSVANKDMAKYEKSISKEKYEKNL